jgi:hypothetical protein
LDLASGADQGPPDLLGREQGRTGEGGLSLRGGGGEEGIATEAGSALGSVEGAADDPLRAFLGVLVVPLGIVGALPGDGVGTDVIEAADDGSGQMGPQAGGVREGGSRSRSRRRRVARGGGVIGGGGGVGRGGGVGGGDALRTEAGDEGAAPVIEGDIAAQVNRADVASADAEP